MVAIPQRNGEIAYVPFERLSDLSEALSKLVSTGEIAADEIFGAKTATAAPSQPPQSSSFSQSGVPSAVAQPPPSVRRGRGANIEIY